jgi:hypothetical protein
LFLAQSSLKGAIKARGVNYLISKMQPNYTFESAREVPADRKLSAKTPTCLRALLLEGIKLGEDGENPE